MILTCPACATSYFVPDTIIGSSGRRVRCKSCGHDWKAMGEDTPLELDEGVAVAASPGFGPTPLQNEELVEEPAPPPLTQAFRARAEQKRRQQQAVRQGLSWGLLSILILLTLGASYIWRDSIVARVPKLASVYSLVGVHTNPIGLDFQGLNAGFARNDIGQIYISGSVINLRDHEVVIPPIRIALLDRNKVEYRSHILRLEKPPVLPGDSQTFSVILPNTDGRFAETKLRFAPEEAQKRTPPAPVEAAPVSAVASDVADEAAAQAVPTATPTEAQPVPAKAAEPKPASPASSPVAKAAEPASQAMAALHNDGLRRIDALSIGAKSN